MSLPRAVIAAEEKAEQALQQLIASKQTQQSEVKPQESSNEEASLAQTENIDEPTEIILDQPEEAPGNQEDPRWESRYKSLEGKYKAEVPRLAASNKELAAKLQSLEYHIEELKSAKPKESLIKPEEVQEFGEPLVDLIRRAAREEVSVKENEIAELKRRLESFEHSTTKNAELGFYEKLNAFCGDWMLINDDKDFHSWLDQYDELAGRRRQDLLAEAEEAKDATRVANFFNAWKKTQTNREATSSRSLESQVVPQSTMTESKPAGKKIWTRQEIANFYSKARSGDIDAKQMVAVEADIHAAQLEGRIR